MKRLVLPRDDDFLPWTGLWGVVLLGFYYWSLNQFVVQRTLGAANLQQGRAGAIFAGFLKLPNLALMVLPGLIALQLYPNLETPDLAFPKLAFELMPIGLRGLIMAALIAAIMSSLDSALNAAGTLVAMDFVKPLRPSLSERQLVIVGRVVTGLTMAFGAAYAPLISNFESLFSYFQSSLSYVVPPIVVVYLLGIFVPRLNGTGAFWTILSGLVIGIPLFVVKEVLGWWGVWGLPDIHYTVMASLMMLVGILVHVTGSAVGTRASFVPAATVWSVHELRTALTPQAASWYGSYRVLSTLLLGLTGGLLWWFW